jgi:hypothetical protein
MTLDLRCFTLTLTLAAAALACDRGAAEGGSRSGDAQTPQKAAASDAATQEHGKAGAKPGSHEDWCGEHEVPESLCARCDPSLVAAFKATGDWCEEHGLPESQCLACNPDLKIVRPPKQDGAQ